MNYNLSKAIIIWLSSFSEGINSSKEKGGEKNESENGEESRRRRKLVET